MLKESQNRVLLVDDSPIYRHLVTRHLQEWGFDVAVANTGFEAWSMLQQPDSPMLVLLDWMMPGMDGLELCRRLRERDSNRGYVYTILLTAKETHADLLHAMDAGADDYLVKPFDERELKARLMVGQRIARLQQELIAAREAMRSAATYDALTGLLNRREIIATLRKELTRSAREKRPVGIILADIDNFKSINDELGHIAGDEVLTEIGRKLRSDIRSYDAVGRYGGEEFLAVLPGCDLATTFTRADQLRASVAQAAVSTSAGPRNVTVSVGIVSATNYDSDVDLQSLLHRADLGLYKAKRNGKNRVEQMEHAGTAIVGSQHA